MIKYERAVIGIDGNCGFALAGPNLMEGESEFVEVEENTDTPLHQRESVAATKAYRNLQKRCPWVKTYALDESHPRYVA